LAFLRGVWHLTTEINATPDDAKGHASEQNQASASECKRLIQMALRAGESTLDRRFADSDNPPGDQKQ
jgi:hypothetical protein